MWRKINVVFKLKTPLHIGYMPFKGSVVSPTRYYVPGKNLWGAVVKRITEYLYEEPKASDYRKIGEQVISDFRFSYFYPYDGRVIYFPRYTDEGLKHGDDKKEIARSEFEHRFIVSFISTAIDYSSGKAKDESLHEIEFISNKFGDKDGSLRDLRIVGCIWVREGAKIDGKDVVIRRSGVFIDDFNIIKELILGGESKYGFGHVLLESIGNDVFSSHAPFRWENPEEVEIKAGEYIVGHLRFEKKISFKGNMELVSGRGYFDPRDPEAKSDKPGGVVVKPEFYLSPGTRLMKNTFIKVLWNGTFEGKGEG